MNIDVGIVNASFSISAIINELYRVNKQSPFLLPPTRSTAAATVTTSSSRSGGKAAQAVKGEPTSAPAVAMLNLRTLAQCLWNVELQLTRTGEPSRCVMRLPPLSFPLPAPERGEAEEEEQEAKDEMYMAFGYVAVLYASGAGRVLGSSSAAAVLAVGQWLQRLLAALLLGPAGAPAALLRLCAQVHRAPSLLPPLPAAVAQTAADAVQLQVLHASVHPDRTALTALQQAAGLTTEGHTEGRKRGREELFLPIQGEAFLQFVERYVAVRPQAPPAAVGGAGDPAASVAWLLPDLSSEAERHFLQCRDVLLQRHLRRAHVTYARRRRALLLKLRWAVSAAASTCSAAAGGGGGRESTVLYLPSALPTNFVMPSADVFFAEPSAAVAPPQPQQRVGMAAAAPPAPRPAAVLEDVRVSLFASGRAVVVCKSMQAAKEVTQHVLLPILLCRALPA